MCPVTHRFPGLTTSLDLQLASPYGVCGDSDQDVVLRLPQSSHVPTVPERFFEMFFPSR